METKIEKIKITQKEFDEIYDLEALPAGVAKNEEAEHIPEEKKDKVKESQFDHDIEEADRQLIEEFIPDDAEVIEYES